MMKTFNRMCRNERGITGLETAIILIAFVVVAAVFAYTALSAGLFSTQRSQEAVYSGLKQTQSTMELRGGVIAYEGEIDGEKVIARVDLTVAVVSGGEPINLRTKYTWDGANDLSDDGTAGPLMISFSSKDTTITECAWTKTWIGYNDGDHLLEEGEKAVITVWFHDPSDFAEGVYVAGTDPFLGSNTVGTFDTFRLELKPSTGATLVVERTTPHGLDPVMNLH